MLVNQYSNETDDKRKTSDMDSTQSQEYSIDIPDELLHPTSRTMFCHWESIRGESTVAKKSDLNLRPIKKILPSVFILQRNPLRQEYSWRLAGTGICKIWGRELTNDDFFRDWLDFEKQTLALSFDAVTGILQPCITRVRAANMLGEEVGFEILALPVLDNKSGNIQILGTIASFRQPEWMGFVELEHFELAALRRIWTDAVPSDTFAAKRRPAVTCRTNFKELPEGY